MSGGNPFLILITLILGLLMSGGNKDIVVEVDEADKPAMIEVRLEGNVEDYDIRNTYGIDVLSSDVVGMVGVPIEVSRYGDGNPNGKVTLVFVYDEDKLTCKEEDLAILYYNENDYFYETVENIDIDYDSNEIRVPIYDLGTYVLEDMRTWIWQVINGYQ